MDDGEVYRDAVGQVVRALRSERGWTLRALSARSGVSVPYLSEIERGRKEASGAILGQLARVFDLPLPELLVRIGGELERRAARPAPADATREALRRALDQLDDADVADVARFLDFLRWRRDQDHAGPTGSA